MFRRRVLLRPRHRRVRRPAHRGLPLDDARGRDSQAEDDRARRALRPLPARRRLVRAFRPVAERHPAGLSVRQEPCGLGRDHGPRRPNAGDFSVPSYTGSVHWYRKDFTLPRARGGTSWLFRFESVNHRAKVWLNGTPLGRTSAPTSPSSSAPARFGKASTGWSCESTAAARPTTSRRSPRRRRHVRGRLVELQRILREVYLRKVRSSTSTTCSRGRSCAAAAARQPCGRRTGPQRHPRARGGPAWRARSRDGRCASGARRIAGLGAKLSRPGADPQSTPVGAGPSPPLHAAPRCDRPARPDVQRYKVAHGHPQPEGQPPRPDRAERPRGRPPRRRDPRGLARPRRRAHDRPDGSRPSRTCATSARRSRAPTIRSARTSSSSRTATGSWSGPRSRLPDGSTLFNVPGSAPGPCGCSARTITRDYDHPSVLSGASATRTRRARSAASSATSGRRRHRAAHGPDAPRRDRGLGIPDRREAGRLPPLDVIGINDYFGWYPGPAGSIADRGGLDGYLEPDPLGLPAPGADGHRVRRRGEPPRPGRPRRAPTSSSPTSSPTTSASSPRSRSSTPRSSGRCGTSA